MSLMDKVKSLFVEEVEEEVIKADVIQVEIPAPEIKESEIKKSDNMMDNVKSEEKPNTPIFFDDEDFKELEKPKVEVKSAYLRDKPVVKTKEELTKRFKPTPIISPVYGVLNKNYHKEDITSKRDNHSRNAANTLDEVRKKAYGTLEDDLETTLFGSNSILFNEEAETKAEETIVEDLLDDLTIEDILDLSGEEPVLSRIKKAEETEAINENELFDLIDSMYEKGDIND